MGEMKVLMWDGDKALPGCPGRWAGGRAFEFPFENFEA